MKIQATSNGAALNYDADNENVKGQHEITVKVIEVGSTIPSGFRVGWINGEHEDGREIDVTCGAGAGSKYLNVKVGDRHFVIDVRDVLDGVLELP